MAIGYQCMTNLRQIIWPLRPTTENGGTKGGLIQIAVEFPGGAAFSDSQRMGAPTSRAPDPVIGSLNAVQVYE